MQDILSRNIGEKDFFLRFSYVLLKVYLVLQFQFLVRKIDIYLFFLSKIFVEHRR